MKKNDSVALNNNVILRLQFPLFLLLSLFFFGGIPLVWAASAQNNIINLTHVTEADREHLQLFFEDTVTFAVSPNFDAGLITLPLPGTQFAKTWDKRVNNQFIQNIRLQKDRSGSLLQIDFSDTTFHPAGHIDFEVTDKILHLYISKDLIPTDLPETASLTGLKTEKKKRGTAGLPVLEDHDFTESIIQGLLALAFVLTLLYSILWLYNRYVLKGFRLKKSEYAIHLKTTYPIGPKQKVAIIEINGISFACGVTPNNISLISEIKEKSFVDYLQSLSDQPDHLALDISVIKEEYNRYKTEKNMTQNIAAVPKHPFATELINKVKNLRPID